MKKAAACVLALIIIFVSLNGCKNSDNPSSPAVASTPNATKTVIALATRVGTIYAIQTHAAQTETAVAGLFTPTETPTTTQTNTSTATATVTETPTTTSTPPGLYITDTTALETGTYNYDVVHIYPGGTLELKGPGGSSSGALVTINCANFILDAGGTVDGSMAGYPAGGPGTTTSGPGYPGDGYHNLGAGHGGAGGAGVVGSLIYNGGYAYDNHSNPVYMGSGSVDDNGGGFFKITASYAAIINGDILVNGGGIPGGSAGGTVYIIADSIYGTGSIQADGGWALSGCGSGGGGIIVLAFHSSYSYTGTAEANAGTGGFIGSNGYVTVKPY